MMAHDMEGDERVLVSMANKRSKTIPNLNSFEGDDRVLVTMANKIAQAHIILEEPLLPSHRIPGFMINRDSWDKAVDSTGLNKVGIQLYGGVDYMHSDCRPYKVIRQAISNAVGNYRKMVKTNLPTEQYFDLAKLDEKSIKRKVHKLWTITRTYSRPTTRSNVKIPTSPRSSPGACSTTFSRRMATVVLRIPTSIS
ncbi:hypothetical protein K440DRAFT_627127 [Wilcoxina mikolae CBS 423.85]|nr:hypothetical protein K440DRAFT_627127 [Wilcoxina mikolae CBS 423.85]